MMDFNFFKPTAEDIQEAQKDYVTLKHGTEYSFIISEVKEDVDNEGKPRVIVKCQITDTDQKGKNYSFFLRQNPTGKRQWIEMLSAFFSQDQIIQGLSPASLVSKQFKSTCKMTAKDGKEYANFYTFKPIDVGTNEIPF